MLNEKDGIRRGPFGSTLKKENFVENSEYVIYEQQNAIYDSYKTRYNISKEKYEELINFSLKENDFIMSGAGTIGRISKVPKGIKQGVINQALIRFRINTNLVDSEYFLQFIRAENMQKKLTGANPGSAISNLVPMSEVKKWAISVPDRAEQVEIGNFLKRFDRSIALLQRKVEVLSQLEQVFLKKLFPIGQSKVPKIRFANFTGDWEQRKLGDLVKKIKSYSLSRDVETPEYTDYKYIHYGDIHRNVASIIDDTSTLPNIKAGDYDLLRYGDVIVADASEDYQGIASPAVVMFQPSYKLVAGLHTIALRPVSVDSIFLYYLLKSPVFRIYGYRMGTGMKVFGITTNNMLKFEGLFPSLEEQRTIGLFLKQFDDTHTLLQKRLDELKLIKKSLLQKMFL